MGKIGRRCPGLLALGAGGALALLLAGAGLAAAQGYTITDLGAMGGVSSSANAINNRGQVIGTIMLTADNTTWHPFLWQNGVMTDLNIPGSTTSQAVGINTAGQVAIAVPPRHALLWQAEVTHDRGSLGSPLCLPTALNDRGQVVGISAPGGTGQNIAHAFRADSDGIHDLGTLGGNWSYAFALNNSGDVVGYSTGREPFPFGYHAFLYSGGVMKDLNTLIPSGSGWVLYGACGINDYGQIVGTGYHGHDDHAFLLNPPAPAAPDGLTASVLSGTRVALSWTDNSSDETAFALWRRTGSGDFARLAVLPPNTTGCTDSDLDPHTPYTYRVRAIGLGGASEWSSEATAIPAPPALAPPMFLSARMGVEGAVQLAWSDNSDAELAFAIWRKGGGSDWACVGVVPPNSTRFTDTNLASGTTYTYRVRGTSTVASDWRNEATLTTPARPAAPTGLTLPWVDAKVIVLHWSVEGADETGITIWRQGGSGDWLLVGVLPPGATLYFDTSVSPATSYTYRLQAHHNDYASDWSSEVSATTPALPSGS